LRPLRRSFSRRGRDRRCIDPSAGRTCVLPLLTGTLYPAGIAHFTTMIVQGFDLALFLPPSALAGYAYLRRHDVGDLLAPIYAVFLSLQMLALLAKIGWMQVVGVSAGPALAIIPTLLAGAVASAVLALRPHWGQKLAAGC
jgi:prepilin signal peptidase PulO-like enzyme (type II secretory pathway)